MSGYEPGVCNIGAVERKRRLALGIASLGAAVVYTGWVLGTDQRYGLLAGMGVLLFGAVLGWLQYHLKFCAGLAALAQYDLSGSSGVVGSVQDLTAL